jgi:hypothetical protein
MNLTHKYSVFAATALAMLTQSAVAQSTYSIPNPIMKPASYGAGANGAPPQRGDGPQAQVPPLPPAISSASLPGQSTYGSAPSNETVIRDTLATFTVTAIVGNRAVLRNNVGGIAMQADAGGSGRGSAGNAQSSSNSQSANGSQPPLARQAVIRVKSDVPVYVSGVELTPTVLESRVEFRIAGKKSIVSTVTLESQSSYGYVPMSAQREVADPAVSTRVSPALAGASVRPADATTGSIGGSPVSNGSATTPR